MRVFRLLINALFHFQMATCEINKQKSIQYGTMNEMAVAWLIRLVILISAVCCFWKIDIAQEIIDNLYSWLLTTYTFNSVYFETLWVVTVYPLTLNIPKLIDAIPQFDKYKLDPKIFWEDCPWKNHLKEAVVYAAPFLLLDTFAVKKYSGVDPREWEHRRASFIQYTRALPTSPPTVGQIVFHLIGAFIIYDALFFIVHFACHKNMFLYKHIHAKHHDHEILTSRVSNRMTVSERIGLVLCANESLKLMGSHPLTRLAFVPILLYWLMENHLGYDLPWGLDKIVPLGLIGGSKRHYQHHINGQRHYEPFFTYIDNWICPLLQKNKSIKSR